jgi:hypothetical protein
MSYWIDNNGEKLGPMRAIDVLRRAQPTTRIYDGENWFFLEDDPEMANVAGSDRPSQNSDRVVNRKAAS